MIVRFVAISALPLALAVASPAWSQSERFCSDRPGLTNDTCLVERGKATIETSVIDWTRERRDGDRTDTTLTGDSVVRFGIAQAFEVDLGWTALGIVREREDDERRDNGRTGDVTLGGRASIVHPERNGHGPSMSVVANLSLPAGREPVGAGDWGAELLVPIAWKLTDRLNIEATPSVEAAVDEDGDGRHLAYGIAAGIELKLSDAVLLDLDGQVRRDSDPDREERGTIALANVALAVKPDHLTQFDIGTNVGLNASSPDLSIVAGFTHAF